MRRVEFSFRNVKFACIVCKLWLCEKCEIAVAQLYWSALQMHFTRMLTV